MERPLPLSDSELIMRSLSVRGRHHE
jgi:hypothetical protein